jgi:hypothetical protein
VENSRDRFIANSSLQLILSEAKRANAVLERSFRKATMSGTNDTSGNSFWNTLPGILTGLAGVLTAVGTILGLLYSAGIFSPKNEDGPSRSATEQEIVEMLDKYYRNINQGDYDEVYALFADRSQQIISLEEYEAWYKTRPGYSLDPYKILEIDVQSDDRATVEVKVTPDSAESEPQELLVEQTVVREEGEWRVIMRDDQIEAFQSD